MENLDQITVNHKGCLPIFYVQITAHWRTSYNSKKFEPKTSIKMVYKGLPKIVVTDKLKRSFFKTHFNDSKKVTDTINNTFAITDYKLINFLGYELVTAKEN
jgi:hypothetical protein